MLEGHCNCGSITVSLATQSPQPGICYCSNCQRAGSGLCSVIYAVPKSEVEIKDPDSVLRNYIDNNTKSGRALTRQFCGSCGSPVASLSGPDAPNMFVKAGLFDHIPVPKGAVFEENKPKWMIISQT